MLKPTSGEILFDGKPWSRKALGEIGALIENPPIYENLSARDNLKVRALLLDVDENLSEAEVMKRYLLEKGIPEDDIILKNRAIDQDPGVCIVFCHEPRGILCYTEACT